MSDYGMRNRSIATVNLTSFSLLGIMLAGAHNKRHSTSYTVMILLDSTLKTPYMDLNR